jgi:hypothetical protein
MFYISNLIPELIPHKKELETLQLHQVSLSADVLQQCLTVENMFQ